MVEEDKTTRSTEETSSEPLVLILTVNGKANLICKEIFLLKNLVNTCKSLKNTKCLFSRFVLYLLLVLHLLVINDHDYRNSHKKGTYSNVSETNIC